MREGVNFGRRSSRLGGQHSTPIDTLAQTLASRASDPQLLLKKHLSNLVGCWVFIAGAHALENWPVARKVADDVIAGSISVCLESEPAAHVARVGRGPSPAITTWLVKFSGAAMEGAIPKTGDGRQVSDRLLGGHGLSKSVRYLGRFLPVHHTKQIVVPKGPGGGSPDLLVAAWDVVRMNGIRECRS